MRRLLSLALLLAGCAATAPTAPSKPDGAATLPSTPVATPAPVDPPVKPSGNPSRAFQLSTLKKVDLNLKGHVVHAWIMDTDQKQEEGMMFLTDKEVKADEGMLFAFTELQRTADNRSFWMHNTLIPLDIVYLSAGGKVLNVGHGKVQDDTPVPAKGDYLNVIELKAGTAARYGLKAGDTVKIPKV